MPEVEIGEVARVVHYLNKHLAKRTISSVVAHEDDIVYGKTCCSASAFQKAVQGRKVVGAAQQGKYFYLTLDKPPHPLLHLGMTGWIKFNTEETLYYRQAKVKPEDLEWPPKYVKFLLKCDAARVDGEKKEAVEVAFVDSRRFARIALIDCDGKDIRKVEPLSRNGPDPVVDKDIFTVEFLTQLLRKKKVPVKALILDQGNISGIGNWVADEVMYQAKLHPEQYSNTFDDEQIQRLYDAITTVCGIACSTLADSTQFPEDWLMKYRWNKGKKDSNVLPNGNKIVHVTVGGRTSAIVPAVQKKTAAVAGDVDPAEVEDGVTVDQSKKGKQTGDEVIKPQKRSRGAKNEDSATETKPQKRSRGKKSEQDTDGGAEMANEPEQKPSKRAKKDASTINGLTPRAAAKSEKPVTPGSRRSSRHKEK